MPVDQPFRPYIVHLSDGVRTRDLSPTALLTSLRLVQAGLTFRLPETVRIYVAGHAQVRGTASTVTALEGMLLSRIPVGSGIGHIWKRRLAVVRHRAGFRTPLADSPLLPHGLRHDAGPLAHEPADPPKEKPMEKSVFILLVSQDGLYHPADEGVLGHSLEKIKKDAQSFIDDDLLNSDQTLIIAKILPVGKVVQRVVFEGIAPFEHLE